MTFLLQQQETLGWHMPFSNSLLYLALACLLDIFNFPTLCLAEWPAWISLHALGFLLTILV